MSRVRPEIKLVRAAVDRKVEEPEDLREFRGSVARRTFIAKDGNEWVYFDHGEGTSPPVVILHGTAGTAVSFYRQVTALAAQGIRTLAVRASAPYARSPRGSPPYTGTIWLWMDARRMGRGV